VTARAAVEAGVAPSNALEEALLSRRLVVCVGSGGVGKTTTAAALAIHAALLGRRALVITIDPARRLAQSLGLSELGNDERAIPEEKFRSAGITPSGTLHAMMLDTRKTFDELIDKVSPDEATRKRVLGNPVYQKIADEIAGSQEYMATEKLWDVYHSDRYDLIVLDTPPMKNALDFLEASGRLTRFLDDKIMRWYLQPYDESRVFGRRIVLGTGALVFRLLSAVFGKDFLDELSEFFLAFKDLYRGFRERSEGVAQLLRDPSATRFVVVCAPEDTSIDDARFFDQQLRERRMPGGLFVVNQVGRFAEAAPAGVESALAPGERRSAEGVARSGGATDDEAVRFADRLDRALVEASARARVDRARVAGLARFAGGGATVLEVPRFREEVYDFRGLVTLARHLFPASRAPLPSS